VDSYSEDAQLFTNGAMRRMRLTAQSRPIPAPRTTISSADKLTPTEVDHIEAQLKNMDPPKIGGLHENLPKCAQRVRLWAVQQPKYYARDDNYLAEISARMYAERQGDKHPLGDVPLIVLTRNKYDYPGSDWTSCCLPRLVYCRPVIVGAICSSQKSVTLNCDFC